MELFIIIFVILAASFFFTKIFKKLGIPKILAPMLVGIIFNLSGFSLSTQTVLGISEIAKIASILILFYIGLELNIKDLKKQSKSTMVLGFSGFLFTFVPSILIGLYVFHFNFVVSFVIASVLSVTAEDLVVVILSDNNKLKSNVGEIIMGAGIIDDLLGIILLAVIPFIAIDNFSYSNLIKTFIGFGIFIIGYFSTKKIVKVIDSIFVKKYLKNSSDLFTYSILFLMGFATFFYFLGFDFAIGGLIAGFLLNFALHKSNKTGILEEHKIDNFVKNITFGFLYFFFFFWIGFNIEFEYLFSNYTLGLILTILAFFGKYLAGLFTAYIGKLGFRTGNSLGLGMSVKGGMDIIIAEIARQNNLISVEIFSAIVFMSLILTVFSSISFKSTISENKHINRLADYVSKRSNK